MKVMLILSLALLGLVRAKAELKVFELELSKVAVAKDEPAVQSELAERDMPLSMLRVHRAGKYAVKVKVGTPGQTVWLAVYMTGSMTWINYRNDSMTNTPSTYEGFDRGQSTSFQLEERDGFNIKSLYGVNISGDMILETMSLNSMPIKQMLLGAVPQSKIDAIGGVGLAAKKEEMEPDPSTRTAFLDILQERRFIKRRAYSIYFDLNRNHGRVLFGGVDTTKFIGELSVLARLPNPSEREVEGFLVGLSGIDIVTDASEPFQVRVPAEGIASILESGAQLSYLPFEIVSQIAENIGASFREDSLLEISCEHKDRPNPQARITLTLPRADGGAPVRINIPLADLVIKIEPEDPVPVCLFGIQANFLLNGPASVSVFGQTLLWHMYVVGDIDNDQIAVAPVNLDLDPDHPTNIVELQASSDSISALRGVDSPNEQGQAPLWAPEDGATDVEVDQPGNSEVVGADASGYLGTAEARGSRWGGRLGSSGGAVW